MKRVNFIVTCGDISITKHKWKSALKVMPEVVKANLLPGESALLIDRELSKGEYGHTIGTFVWKVNNDKNLIVYINKVATPS